MLSIEKLGIHREILHRRDQLWELENVAIFEEKYLEVEVVQTIFLFAYQSARYATKWQVWPSMTNILYLKISYLCRPQLARLSQKRMVNRRNPAHL